MLAQQEPVTWPAALAVSGGVAVVMIAAGILVMSIATRAADGRLRRNAFAGIRTRATRASDEAWLAAHRAGEGPTRLGGWLSIATGVVPVVGGLLVAAVGDGEAETYMAAWVALLLAGVAALIGAVVYGAVRGQRAARAVNEGDPFAG